MIEGSEVSYPNVKQSWGIAGIFVLLTLVFAPVHVLLGKVVGQEVSMLIYYLLATGLAFWITHKKREKITSETGYNLRPGAAGVMVLLVVIVIAIQIGIVVPVVSLIPMPEVIKKAFADLSDRTGVASFVMIVIAAPILEELIFRGIVLHGLLKRYSPVRSIIISSVLFGLVHLNPWQFVSASILGALSGWVYYRTRNLTLSIFIHMANNLIAFAAMYFMKESTNLDRPISESYGGPLNMAIVMVAVFAAGATSLHFLRKKLKQEDQL